MMRVARSLSPLAVLLVSIALLFSTTSAQFITNGDFDGAACGFGGTSAAPWTGGLQSIDSTLYNSFAAQSGSCVTDFYSAGGPIAAAQQLTGLTIGSTYIVTFYGASVDTLPGTLATFSVSIGGSPVGAFTSTSAFSWQQFSVSFTAISTTPTLSFTANQLALIDTVTVALVATVVGDPHFQGWNGRGYDFDGEPGGVYNLLSDAYVQVNTRLDRVLATDRLYLPGVFMTEMVFKFGANHSLWIHAGDHEVEHGAVVLLDGREIQPSASQHVLPDTVGTLEAESAVRYERITPAYASSVGLPSGDRFVNVISIRLGSYYQFEVYTVENGFDDNESEWYLEFPRRFLDFSSRLLDRTRRPHGILGQTAPMRYPGRKAEEWHLEGEQEDYRIAEDNIYGDEFVYNRFSAKQ